MDEVSAFLPAMLVRGLKIALCSSARRGGKREEEERKGKGRGGEMQLGFRTWAPPPFPKSRGFVDQRRRARNFIKPNTDTSTLKRIYWGFFFLIKQTKVLLSFQFSPIGNIFLSFSFPQVIIAFGNRQGGREGEWCRSGRGDGKTTGDDGGGEKGKKGATTVDLGYVRSTVVKSMVFSKLFT